MSRPRCGVGKMSNKPLTQLDLAREVIGLFKDLDDVRSVFLRGSLVEGIFDRYSDIDIGIDVSGSDNARFTETIIERMQAHFDLHFHDWATSLLPDQYILTFFVKDVPIYWNIDFDCTATPHAGTLQREEVRVTLNMISHALKPWVHMMKYLIRGQEGIEDRIRMKGKQQFPGVDLQNHSPQQILRAMLDDLYQRADGQFSEFFAVCYQVYDDEMRR